MAEICRFKEHITSVCLFNDSQPLADMCKAALKTLMIARKSDFVELRQVCCYNKPFLFKRNLPQTSFGGIITLAKTKKRLGDRKDGVLLRDLDSMHFIVPLIYPNRCDNEAYISERIDLTNINAYLAKKNKEEDVFPYTLFHVIVAALIKTVTLRPKMNRFIANKNIYQRNEVSASFVVKKQFSDEGGEALAFIHAKDEDTIDTIHQSIFKQISSCRGDEVDRSTDSMDILNKMPRFLSKFLVWIITKL